ncbi:unnamed protein product [Adineta steineri]|uniref:Uncharacterized protein n=1 Tax=Adineta steineri TaxID=433720 RepID=A0A813UWA2_9BILA|nr:unnamed protein product [Adineta steineri]
MDWIKNDDDSFDIIYFQDNNMIIKTKQFFDNENFSIQFKMDENNQSFLQMKINDYIDENDGSLKSINEFISEIESGIYGLDLVKKKRRWEEKTNWLLNQEKGLFLISKNGENKDIMDWIKNGDDLFDIIYFQDNNMIIETKQFFDNENFSIQFKMDENNQSFLQMKINDYINENDGSLKSINEFISEIESGIYGLDLVKK